jgi:hypothetical protein
MKEILRRQNSTAISSTCSPASLLDYSAGNILSGSSGRQSGSDYKLQVKCGHEPQEGLDTKTNGLTVSRKDIPISTLVSKG